MPGTDDSDERLAHRDQQPNRNPPEDAEEVYREALGSDGRRSVVATYRAGHLESFTMEIMPSQGQSLGQQKTIRQSDYEGYTECTESIGGRRVIIQSFRGGGVIMLGDRSFPPFTVVAVCELSPGRILRFDGSTPTREAQEDLLAIIRTLEFTR